MTLRFPRFCWAFLILAFVFAGGSLEAASAKKKASARKPAVSSASSQNKKGVSASSRKASAHRSARRVKRHSPRRARYSPWSTPTYADSTLGDQVDGEDLLVRRAAVDALGPYNGSVVVVDPDNGRILTIVNQKLAFGEGFQPCSTVKVPVALAALTEGLVDLETRVRLYGKASMDLTDALAVSNNPFFAKLGDQLGFEKVSHYLRMFGVGEKACFNVPQERPRPFPHAALPPQAGGVGMMTSFGSSIAVTPLQLAALFAAIANGGTLYYLQYPQNETEAENFIPRVKRRLDIGPQIEAVRYGMQGATTFGTARRAAYSDSEPVFGKTGTCTEGRTHLGWFASYNQVGNRSLVVSVLLTGGSGVSGPTAAGIAGKVYQQLSASPNFFDRRSFSPATLTFTPNSGIN